MTLQEQVFAQAVLLSGETVENQALLQLFCNSAVAGLQAQLREGITVEACHADFVAAASLLALAAMSEAETMHQPEQFQVGDLTIKQGTGSVAAQCLRRQAQMILYPYLQDRVILRRV